MCVIIVCVRTVICRVKDLIIKCGVTKFCYQAAKIERMAVLCCCLQLPTYYNAFAIGNFESSLLIGTSQTLLRLLYKH